jgi:uncharacterized protein YgiM (DUF1202 family)
MLTGVVVNANSAAGGLMRRKGPGTKYEGMGRAPDGTEFRILGQYPDDRGNPWYFVSHNGEEFYVSASYIRLNGEKTDTQVTPPQDNNVPSYTEKDIVASGTVVKTDSLRVRSDPSTKNPKKGDVSRGTVLNFDKVTSNGWYRIADGLYKGLYVSGNYIQLIDEKNDDQVTPPQGGTKDPSTPKMGRVTASSLNMRANPFTNFAVLFSLSYNTEVEVVAKVKNTDGYWWFEILYHDTIGYVRSDYIDLIGISLEDIPTKKFSSKYPVASATSFWAIIDKSVDLFDENGNVKQTLPNYALVQVQGQSFYNAEHYVVNYFGSTGIVHTNELSIVKDTLHTDITLQKTTLIRNGKLIVQSDCVTGLKDQMDTPVGKFSILNYGKKVLLEGTNLDGTPYAQPVDYWMRFYRGCGYHDATYRYKFGGDIYKTHGSHGCINLPYAVAEQIYSNVYVGMPVYVSGF